MAGEKQAIEGGGSKISNKVLYWCTEIAAARKREKSFRHEGRRILEIYNGAKKDSCPFNILYSNTETILPALYNNQPRPVVGRRFKDADPLGKISAQAGQRGLEFLVDTNIEDYQPFDSVMTDAVLDALLPGRGATRVKYDAEVQEPAEGDQEGMPYVQGEIVCYDSLKWDRWTHGYAKKWNRVPWVAFDHDVTKAEAEKLFGREKAAKIVYTEASSNNDKEDSEPRTEDEKTDEDRKTAVVHEIWVKRDRKVLFVSPNYPEGILKEDDDPLELTGFFPMPEPLRFLRKANDLSTTPIYALYENQAKELNRLTVRINRIAEAIKVRGVYDGQLGEIEDVLRADDNTLTAATNAASLQNGGLEKAIWLMPLEKLITVLQQLYIARENCKKVIYEITGISDILRGASVASETATAQEIKQQWGTLRIKRLQKDVQRYARDLLRISLEVAAKKFNERTWAGMTGLPFATEADVVAAQQQVQIAREKMGAVQPQQLMQMVPEAMQTLQKPAWAKVLELLRNDTQRSYRIDIETNSTIDVEASEDQKIMAEVLQAVSTFVQGVTPLVTAGALPFQAAQAMLLAVVRRYRFGPEIEEYIMQMQAPKSPDEGKQKELDQKLLIEKEKHQFEMRKTQLELQAKEAEMEGKKQLEQLKLQIEREKLELKRQEMQLEHQARVAELQAKEQEARIRANEAQMLSEIRVQEARRMPQRPTGGKPNGGARATS